MPRTKSSASKRVPRKRKQIQSIKGMHDILPMDSKYWEVFFDKIRAISHTYDYRYMETPVLEKSELFKRAIGDDTDIVSKEMYTFKDKSNENLTLRPEWTASFMRAYIENGLAHQSQPVKVYTHGPLFRRENPQAGRYRQFHQANFEVIGSEKPVMDAELIFVGWNFLKQLGLKDIIVKINSIGTPDSRKEYIDVLVNYFASKKSALNADQKKRLKNNPLRLLDSKDKKLKTLVEQAPQSIDYLDDESHEHFKSVLEFLDEVEVTYQLDHTLVRGLDYYSRTTFEFFAVDPKTGEHSLALGGGGRYDYLAAELGDKSEETAAAAGMALGSERIIEYMKDNGIKPPEEMEIDVYLVQLGELAKKKSLKLFHSLVESGLVAKQSFNRDSIKSQLKQADKNNAKVALILGQKEALEDTILIRDMESGIQEVIPVKNIAQEVRNRIEKGTIIKKKSKK